MLPGKKFKMDRFLLILVLVFSLIFAGSMVSALDQSYGFLKVNSIPSKAAFFVDSDKGSLSPLTFTYSHSATNSVIFITNKTKITSSFTTKPKSYFTTKPKSYFVPKFVPKFTPTTTTTKDPIIGVWRYSDSSGFDDRYRFNADGTYVESVYSPSTMATYSFSGTWSAKGGNSYTCQRTATGTISTIVYNPTQKAIYDTLYPSLLLTPYSGDVAAASTSSPGSGTATTTNNITGTWNTDFGKMVITQSGSTVHGEYDHDDGKLDGILSGKTLTGRWSESPSYKGPSDAGGVVLTFSDNYASFSGTWGYDQASTGGSWSGTKASASTSTPISTPVVVPVQDPIIGVWKYSASTGYDNRYRFNADGTFVESVYSPSTMVTYAFSGTWSAQGGNSYACRMTATGTTFTIIYNPTQKAIYDTLYPSLLLTPYSGDVMKGPVLSGIK
jgi:hypothetical protein